MSVCSEAVLLLVWGGGLPVRGLQGRQAGPAEEEGVSLSAPRSPLTLPSRARPGTPGLTVLVVNSGGLSFTSATAMMAVAVLESP